jgi:Domain of unknown function (DUF4397)
MNPSTPTPLRRRALLSAAAAASLWLAGCGGGDDDDGRARLRAINLTTDLDSLDLYRDDDLRYSALARATPSNYVATDADTYELKVTRAGEGTSLLSADYSLGKDSHYTAVIWGRESALRLSNLQEDEDDDDIDSGNSRLRVFNAASDVGSVDVYLTTASAELADASATASAVASGSLAGYRELDRGSYRLRVTGAGDVDDVRLDLPSITLGDREHATLILTAGSGGVLVNAVLLVQQGAATLLNNTQARVRVVAGVDGGGTVSATFGARTLVGALRSPSVGNYALVDAGTADLVLRVNGSTALSGSRGFDAGADYTLLAFGVAGTAELRTIADDNRLPSNTNRVKVRLLHGAANVEPLTLAVDYAPAASDVASGTASAFASLNKADDVRLDVTGPSYPSPLYTTEDLDLQGLGVYTVFVLGGHTAPTGVLRKDR